ncbi:AAA family ATPase [Cytobacillus kochii]|uniref:FtsK/SpoIIIE domain-containing protein n=1 Tax=Cytobacillus kochii TaxID=859143 RepID=UPI001CD467A2|nr:FtsK/SpoIIIE domain-containing protein [Cytobacillus kochii]MCA1025700.1 AAA family ATPase [Cytobacillus kochii]
MADILERILSSRYIGNGVYSVEQVKAGEEIVNFLMTPSFDKYPYKAATSTLEIEENTNIFSLSLNSPTFLPLDINQKLDLLKELANLDDDSYIQILFCKRTDNWRVPLINKYEAYLKGNTNPLDNTLLCNVQTKVINFLSSVTGVNETIDEIEEIENKILQDGFRIEVRLVASDSVVKNVNESLKSITLFNSAQFNQVETLEYAPYLQSRSFRHESVDIIFSKQELLLLLQKETTFKPITNNSSIKAINSTPQNNSALQILADPPPQQIANESKEKLLNQGLKRIKLIKQDLKIKEIVKSASVQIIKAYIPKDKAYSNFKNKIEDIRAATGNQNITLEIGDEPDIINFCLPQDQQHPIYLKTFLESPQFEKFKQDNELPIIIGEKTDGKPLFGSLTNFRHMLVSGTSGSGKSVFVNTVITTLLLSVPSDRLNLYLIDPKFVELSVYETFPQTKKLVTDMMDSLVLLNKICIQMDKRYELFKEQGVKNIQDYNQKEDNRIPYMVIVIDEFADLMITNKTVENYIIRIAQKGRAAGIHLILATQRPSVDVVTGLIKANMPVRISFKVASGTDSRTILDKTGAEKLMGKGDGIAKIEGCLNELERFQAPVISMDSEEEGRIFEQLSNYFSELPTSKDEIDDVRILTPIEKLKAHIAQTGETRISELQKMMGIRINDVSNLVKELVQEGWLQKEGRGYKLIISEEELEEWR